MNLKYFLLTFCAVFLITTVKAQEPAASAEVILKEAYQQAAKEKKNVFIIFHASWCGWCHKMDEAMNDESCKSLFNDQYVIRHLVVNESPQNKKLENPGAQEVLAKFHGDKQGIPFWLILDENGKLLADSQIRPQGAGLDVVGENIGCPSKKEEIAAFTKILKNTSRLTEQQLGVINKRFEAINTGH
nr:thioredoxin family protein [Pedobacter sp. ASV19]